MPDRLRAIEALLVLWRPKLAARVDEGSARDFLARILRTRRSSTTLPGTQRLTPGAREKARSPPRMSERPRSPWGARPATPRGACDASSAASTGFEVPLVAYATGTPTRVARDASDPRGRSGGCGFHLLHVLRHNLHRPAELNGRAELHDLGSRIQERRVAGADVVGVAGLEELLAVA